MATSTTTVTGRLLDATGTAIASEYVYFRLKQAGADNDVTPNEVFGRVVVEAQTDSSGDISTTLWVNGDSDIESVYEITTKNKRIEPTDVIIPTSASGGTIDIAELMINHVVSGSSTQQSTVLADAKAYTDVLANDPSDNVSFTAANWVADLDVYVTGSVDGFFADPSTNASFSASEWRNDLGLATDDAVVFDSLTVKALTVSEGFSTSTTQVTTPTYTALVTDNTILAEDDTAGSEMTITPLSAATAGDGFTLTVIKEGITADVTIAGIGTLTEQGESVTIRSNGTDYRII